MSDFKVIYMDVGQGDCALILFPDANQTNWLIDCGSTKNSRYIVENLQKEIKLHLTSRGMVIHRLILTHPDEDHYNLVRTIMQYLTIREVVYGGYIEGYQNGHDKNAFYNLLNNNPKTFSNVIAPNKQLNWNPVDIGGVQVNFLVGNYTKTKAHEDMTGEDTNNCSIVIMMSFKGWKFFFMGDAFKLVENFILMNWPANTLSSTAGTILKLGHHGSETSSSIEWIKAINPQLIIISSDTKTFGGAKAIPTLSKIEEIKENCKKLYKLDSHNYIVWCDQDKPAYKQYHEKAMSIGPTLDGICGTLIQLNYTDAPNNINYTDQGGPWLVGVSNQGKGYVIPPKPEKSKLLSDLEFNKIYLNPKNSHLSSPMTIAELTKILESIKVSLPFVLASDVLGIEAVKELFETYLPNKILTIISPQKGTDLSITGQISLPKSEMYPNYPNPLNVEVTFASDQQNVTGISIRIALPGWEIQTSFLNLSGDFLKNYGCSLFYLLLAAIPDPSNPTTPLSPQIGFGADLLFVTDGASTNTIKFNSLLSSDLQADYLISASFDPISLKDINKLSQFAIGGDFTNVIPSGVLPTPDWKLLSVGLCFDPLLKKFLNVSINVQLLDFWNPIPLLQFDIVTTTFNISFNNVSFSNSISPSIFAQIFTTMHIAGIPLDAQMDIPTFEMQATIKHFINLSQVLDYAKLGDHVIPKDIVIDYLSFYFNPTNTCYNITCSSSENWTIIPGIVLDSLFFSFTGQGGQSWGVIVAAQLTFCVDFMVSASYLSADKKWQFMGRTAQGQEIPIGTLIEAIATTFNIKKLPSWLSKMQMNNLSFVFETVSNHFVIGLTADIPIAQTSLSIQVNIDYTPGIDALFTGSLTIGTSTFVISFDKNQSDKILTASWNTTGQTLKIADIIKDLGFSDFPSLPIDIDLESIGIAYDSTTGAFAFIVDSASFGKATFASLKGQYFFALHINGSLNLSNLPLIGKELSGELTVSLENIQVCASSNFDLPSIAAANTLINKLVADLKKEDGYPRLPSNSPTGISKELGLSLDLNAGGQVSSFHIDTAATSQISHLCSDSPQSVNLDCVKALRFDEYKSVDIRQMDRAAIVELREPISEFPTAQGINSLSFISTSDNTKWFDIQKTFGPVSFQKIGIRFVDGKLGILMNASLTTGGLTISLLGLGAESTLKQLQLDFTLAGIDILYAEGDIEISGGLTGGLTPELHFTGELIISTSELTIAALGAYAELDGNPSLFIYAVLDYPIGGPAFCFITGLAAGFGFNRKLLIPNIDKVATFPFVEWAMDFGSPGMDMSGNIGAQVAAVLATVSNSGIVAPSIGDDWLAFGVSFTSFEVVNSFALATVIFGTQFEIDILGLSRMSIPTPQFRVAYAELAIKASFCPETGFIGITGQLTPASYVFSNQCHFTGGFAYYFWFSGEHAGAFVVTLGGYSPRFTPPQYYPPVPRLGLSWQIDDDISVKGDLYYAITSCAIMAGGGLNAVWSTGPLRAWFDVEADFLLVYIPFHYFIEADIDLGASFSIDLLFTSITITIHIGVGLEIWGPDFTGEVDVDLDIISFTISFGSSDKDASKTTSWINFYNQLLPHAQSNPLKPLNPPNRPMKQEDNPPALIQIKMTSGLSKKLSEKAGDLNYLVNGEQLEMVISFAIPLKGATASSNINLDQSPITLEFGVGPTGTQNGSFSSKGTLTFTELDGQKSQLVATNYLQNIPTSLWLTKEFDSNGVPIYSGASDPLNNTTIPNVLVGYQLNAHIDPPDHSKELFLKDLLFEPDEQNPQYFAWSKPYCSSSDPFTTETVLGTITDPKVNNTRAHLLQAIAAIQPSMPMNINVQDLSDPAKSYLLAPPILSLLGENKGAPV